MSATSLLLWDTVILIDGTNRIMKLFQKLIRIELEILQSSDLDFEMYLTSSNIYSVIIVITTLQIYII